jgi:hypothetical protein
MGWLAAIAFLLWLVSALMTIHTNCGGPYHYQAGWSNAQRRPWTIRVEFSPLGAMATGYFGVVCMFLLSIIVYAVIKSG